MRPCSIGCGRSPPSPTRRRVARWSPRRASVASGAPPCSSWPTISTPSAIHRVEPLDGAWPPPDGTVVVERSSVEFAQVGVGQAIELEWGEGPAQVVTVAGIARDSGLAPGWMEHVVYAFATPATLAALGAPTTLDQLQFTVRDRSLDRSDVRRIAADVRTVVEATGRRVLEVDVPEPGEHVHAGQMESLLMTQGGFGAAALVLSGFLVVNLMTALLVGQRREIGVMKAIGASPWQIAGLYLGLALALGLVACAIAIPVAATIGFAYARFSAEMLNFDLAGIGLPPWVIAVQVAAGSLVPIAAAALPVLQACRMPVSAALRSAGIEGLPSGPAAKRLSGNRPLLLGLRNAFRKRQRLLLTLVTLALGGAVYLAALNLRASIRASVDYLFGTLMAFDAVVTFDEPHPPAILEAAAAGGTGCRRGRSLGGRPGRRPGQRRDAGQGLSGELGAARDRDPRAARRERPVARRRRSRRAGRQPPCGQGRGRAHCRGRGDAHGSRATDPLHRGRHRRFGPAAHGVRGPGSGGADQPAGGAGGGRRSGRKGRPGAPAPRRARPLGPHGRLEPAPDRVAPRAGGPPPDGRLVPDGVAQMLIVVGGLALASTMSLAVLERTREIGVLRSIGASHGRIHALFQIEGLTIALLSWTIAIPLSLPLSLLLGRRFGRVMIQVPDRYLPEPSALLWWLGLVLAVSVVACAWPAWRATRVPIAKALAYE